MMGTSGGHGAAGGERLWPGMALAALLVAGIALRAWTMLAFPSSVLTIQAHDGVGYLSAAGTRLGVNGLEPLGYPIFLRVLHFLSPSLIFTLAVQHALGLTAGALLYLTARQLGANRWLALIPPALTWLGNDNLFLEHVVLSEALFIPLVALTLFCGVRSLSGGSGWLVGLGASSVALLAVRSVALPLPLIVIGWVLASRWRLRAPLRAAAAVSAAALLSAVAYAAVEKAATGRWSVQPAGSGWVLYARAAEFADCHRFPPPPGTSVLCDPQPAGTRPGNTYFHWIGGPAIKAYHAPPSHDAQVRAFAEAAIIHQPAAFLRLAGGDLVRYVDPNFDPRPDGFTGPNGVAFLSVRTLPDDPQLIRTVSAYYGPVHASTGDPGRSLRGLASITHVGGFALVILTVAGAVGVGIARARSRWGIVLALAIALELLVAPTLTGASWRYAVPAEGPLAVAAVSAWSGLRPPRWALRRPATP